MHISYHIWLKISLLLIQIDTIAIEIDFTVNILIQKRNHVYILCTVKTFIILNLLKLLWFLSLVLLYFSDIYISMLFFFLDISVSFGSHLQKFIILPIHFPTGMKCKTKIVSLSWKVIDYDLEKTQHFPIKLQFCLIYQCLLKIIIPHLYYYIAKRLIINVLNFNDKYVLNLKDIMKTLIDNISNLCKIFLFLHFLAIV